MNTTVKESVRKNEKNANVSINYDTADNMLAMNDKVDTYADKVKHNNMILSNKK